MFYHILPCLAMFSHVLPCFTIFYHVWPCLELMRKDWENDDDHVSDQNDICFGLDCNIQGYSSGLVRSMYSSMPCLTTVSSTMARGSRRRSSRPASKSSWWWRWCEKTMMMKIMVSYIAMLLKCWLQFLMIIDFLGWMASLVRWKTRGKN